jgi:hypothetical protein
MHIKPWSCCEHGNEASNPIKIRKSLDQVSDYQPLRQDTLPKVSYYELIRNRTEGSTPPTSEPHTVDKILSQFNPIQVHITSLLTIMCLILTIPYSFKVTTFREGSPPSYHKKHTTSDRPSRWKGL